MMVVSKKKLRIGTGVLLIALFCFTNGLHTYIYGTEYNAIITLVLGIFLVWSRRMKFINRPMTMWVVLLLGIMLFNNQDNAQFGTVLVFNTLFYIVLWIMFCIFSEQNDWHESFLKTVLVFGLFHAFCTWLFYFMPSLYRSRIAPLFSSTITSLLSQYNHGWMPGLSPSYSTNGIYLGMTSCIIVGIILVSEKKSKLKILEAILLITALLLTGKRAQTLALIIAFLVLYYFYNSNKKTSRLFKIIAIAIVGIAVFYVAAQFVPSLGNFITRFEAEISSGDVTEGRSVRFAQAWLLFLQNPILGIGWDGTIYYFKSIEGIIINVHNIYIQLLAETGLVGGIAYFLFFSYNLYWAIKLVVSERTNRYVVSTNGKKALCCALAIEVFFLFYGITGNPLYDYQALFPYLGACAIVQYYRRDYIVVLLRKLEE